MDELVLLAAIAPALATAGAAVARFIRTKLDRSTDLAEIDKLATAIRRPENQFDDQALSPGLSSTESKFAGALLQSQVSAIKRVDEVHS